jgi:adenylate cyclase
LTRRGRARVCTSFCSSWWAAAPSSWRISPAQAADRRGDARVFLLSLAFLATGGFLAVHAIGTPGILLNNELPGFKVAIPAGMVLGSVFASASAFIEIQPHAALAVVRHRHLLRRIVLGAVAVWALF